MINVTIYNEFVHERTEPNVAAIYPDGIHAALKEGLACDDFEIRTVTLDDVSEGLSESALKKTDVLVWWGHMAHDKVPDEVAARIQNEVACGMGAVFLHSAHHSKPFRALMGTPCHLSWREDGDKEYLWVCNPSHPIAQGIDRFIRLDREETYCEPFCVPEPDETVFVSSYEGGEAMRSGLCYHRGYGRVFYFQPGHETYPTYKNKDVLKVIANAIRWAKPAYRADSLCAPNIAKIRGAWD